MSLVTVVKRQHAVIASPRKMLGVEGSAGFPIRNIARAQSVKLVTTGKTG